MSYSISEYRVIEFEELPLTVNYYPSEHRVVVETEVLRPQELFKDETDLLKERLNLEYTEDRYGEINPDSVEIFLEEDSGLSIVNGEEVFDILEPCMGKVG